jgi:hypothetical protein
VRQTFSADHSSPSGSGSKLDSLIARSAGFLNILCVLLTIDASRMRPLESILKQTVTSPSMRSRRAINGYLGNAVTSGMRSVELSIMCD